MSSSTANRLIHGAGSPQSRLLIETMNPVKLPIFETVLREGLDGTPEMEAEIRAHVAGQICKLARPKRILWSENLPTTRSGKIMRRLLRDIAEGRTLGDVTTLRDPAVMADLEQKVAAAREQED